MFSSDASTGARYNRYATLNQTTHARSSLPTSNKSVAASILEFCGRKPCLVPGGSARAGDELVEGEFGAFAE